MLAPHPDKRKVNRLIINLLAFYFFKFAQYLHNISPLLKSSLTIANQTNNKIFYLILCNFE